MKNISSIYKPFFFSIIQLFLAMLFMAMLFISCENTVNYPFPKHENKIILNGLITNTKTLDIKISQSYPAYDKDPLRYIFLEDAQVFLYASDQLVATPEHVYEGSYRSNFRPQFNIPYQIRVVHHGDTVGSTSMVPAPVNFEIDTVYPIVKDGKDFIVAEVVIDDPPGENYYYLTSSTDPVYFKTRVSDYQTYSYWINDENLGVWPSDNENTPEIFTFTDKHFDGRLFRFNIQTTPLHTSFEDVTMFFSLHTITKDLYQYLKTLNNQIHAASSNLSDFPEVYNNIENGFGIFSGYSQHTDSFTFKGNNEIKELSYGAAFYKEKTYNLDDARLYTNSLTKNFSLSLGAIKIFIDDATQNIVSDGMNIVLNLVSNQSGGPSLGTYQYETPEETGMAIRNGTTFISDYAPTIKSDSLSVTSGELSINEIFSTVSNAFTNKKIIKLHFDIILSNNEHVVGQYEEPLIEIHNDFFDNFIK